MEWYKADLHLHTPASDCYKQADVTYYDILKRAADKGLDVIAFADHNTVRGYAEMFGEIRDLELLEALGRLAPDERDRLESYRVLMRKVLVLPGFEFTATFGFHVLGVFSQSMTVRDLEFLLLRMGIPSTKLDEGTGEVGATVDVLTAYRLIREAGGIVIAAHANSSHGVALQGLGFGGQTKIAFTQDQNLHALEVTDFESSRSGRSALFFNGSRPEYPRRMHILQSSDAHRLDDDPHDKTQFGVGGRPVEFQLPSMTFAALKNVLEGTDFSRIRPHRPAREPFDHVQVARDTGASIVQSFHESMGRRGGRLHAVLADMVAFANTNGGTVYIGAAAKSSAPIRGVDRPEEAVTILRAEVQKRISPPLEVDVAPAKSGTKHVLRVSVPSGPEKPYALDGTKIYVRQETETSLAVRDEIIQIISGHGKEAAPEAVETPGEAVITSSGFRVPPPRTGVEVLDSEERKGVRYHTLRDLRNGSVVSSVTRESARRLWRYAISEHGKSPRPQTNLEWQRDLALRKTHRRGGKAKYDLAQLDESGATHYYYGVTEEGLQGEWKDVVGLSDNGSSQNGAPDGALQE
ncbi:MAG: RNA-binding domain-containing protein [Anaerolineae bacterium]